MYSEAVQNAVAQRVIEAVRDPKLWPMVLDRLCKVLGASKASMHEHRFTEGPGALRRHVGGDRTQSSGYEASSRAEYAEHYAVQDPYVNLIWSNTSGLSQGVSGDLIDADLLRRTEFYDGYGRRNGIFHVAWTVVERNPHHASGLALVRPESANPFGQDEVLFLSWLTPLLLNAFQFQRMQEQQQVLLNSWDDLDYAVFRLTMDGDIIASSEAGKAAEESATILRTVHGRLHASDEESDTRLQKVLRQMQSCCAVNVAACGETVLLLNVRTERFATLSLNRCGYGANGEGQILARLHDPSGAVRSRLSVLRKTFGLGLQEARLADYLGRGGALTDVSARLGLEYETARTYLKVIFRKLYVSNQSELVVLVRCLSGAGYGD